MLKLMLPCHDAPIATESKNRMAKHPVSPSVEAPPPALPLVVRVGLSGTRLLNAHSRDDTPQARAWLASLQHQLQSELEKVPGDLGLSSQHFIVGLSQLAIGADLLFAESLQRLQWPQRLLLPQPRDAFLQASGSLGPDFLPHERSVAERLLEAPHVIDVAVVGGTGTRAERFDETNLRILGESDLLVCLRVERASDKPGGVQQLLKRAEARGLTVLELVLESDEQSQPTLRAVWHRREKFITPKLPASLASIESLRRPEDLSLPSFNAFAERLKLHTSSHAGQMRDRFAAAAAVIVGTHAAATLVASLALKLPHAMALVATLVVVELALLSIGLWKHLQLHHQGATAGWALSRLCAEIGRSALALDALPGALQALQWLPFPDSLAPVLRTLSVLHLARHHRSGDIELEAVRHHYLTTRLSSPKGQLAYYLNEQERAQAKKDRADRIFTWLSGLAIGAVLLKLAVAAMPPIAMLTHHHLEMLADSFGVAAVALPVLAVAAVSLAAAFDLEARASTFREMHEFLVDQADHVAHASSVRELTLLVITIEARLLGETITWYARRVFTGVA